MTRSVILLFVLALLAPVPATACEPTDVCVAPEVRRYPAYARQIGIDVEREWVNENIESLHESFRPGCEAFGRCLSVWGNPLDFCRLLLTLDLRSECESRFDMSADLRGWQQCRAVADIFSVAQHKTGEQVWPGIQKCAAEEAGARGVPSPRVEIDPPGPKPGESVDLMVRAYHPESGVPMYGYVTIDGVLRGPTFQAISYELEFRREVDELGRVGMRPPEVVVSASPARGSGAPAFPAVTVPFTTPIPATRLTIDPPPDKWSVGANVVRVVAHDVSTGVVLDGSVMQAGAELGPAGRPVVLELRGDASPCGDPVWFRPREANRPDEPLPVPPCR